MGPGKALPDELMYMDVSDTLFMGHYLQDFHILSGVFLGESGNKDQLAQRQRLKG